MISAKHGNTAAVHEMRLKMQPFDAMPDKNKANLGLATVFLLIQRCARVLYVGINALTRLVLPKNMDARLAGNQNAAIFDDFWQSRTPTYWTYFKREFGKKGVNIGVLAGFVLLLSGIKSDEKIYELRLYDEKRQKIKLGDYIVFTAENGERLTAKVTDILRFNDFVKLYAALPKTKIGYKAHEIADPEDMAQYYAENEIKKYGVVALKIELANLR